MRPIYETDADVTREKDVADWLADRWSISVCKNPRLYAVDYCAMRDGILASWLEIKNRSYTKDQIDKWGGYMMGATKVAGMALLIGVSKRPAFLCVNLAGEIYSMRYKPDALYKTEYRGRADRGDPDDMEPCLMFPMSEFSFLGRIGE